MTVTGTTFSGSGCTHCSHLKVYMMNEDKIVGLSLVRFLTPYSSVSY